MTRQELCRLICECLENEGTFPNGCEESTLVPELSESQRERTAACIAAGAEARGCEILVNPDHIAAGRTVGEVCSTLWWRLDCEDVG